MAIAHSQPLWYRFAPITLVQFQASSSQCGSGIGESVAMRIKITVLGLMLVAFCYAKEPKSYQSGTLLQMDSVECGYDENGGKSFAGEVLGTDSQHKKTHQLLCQEYLLQNERVIYRIRPQDEKHPVLLPVGEKAQFRIHKDKMLLLVEDGDNKEREYNVVSMTPRAESKAAEAAPSRLNHLP
jgi:hypothetical protein